VWKNLGNGSRGNSSTEKTQGQTKQGSGRAAMKRIVGRKLFREKGKFKGWSRAKTQEEKVAREQCAAELVQKAWEKLSNY